LDAEAHVGLIAAHLEPQADGIWDYTQALAAGLRSQGVRTTVFEWRDGELPDGAEAVDAVVVQYNPFSYGRRGFAPRLPLTLARLRRRGRRGGGPVVAVMFHETYVDMKNFRWALMGAWQRVQLALVQSTADVQLCTIQRWAERLRRTRIGPRAHHLPVASNLPDARASREAARADLGADERTLVISCLGLRHAGRLERYVVDAARCAAAVSEEVLLLNLGLGDNDDRRLGPNVLLRNMGFLAEERLAALFAASDVFLAPYADGVSTRRTTVMAALQHGVPVIGTSGHLTDDLLHELPAFTLTPVGDIDAFTAAVVKVAADPEERRRLGEAGRATYEREFDWPVLVRRLRGYIGA
jgi:glycosyltransferase involved in cell wall biosynthesis